MYYHIARRIGWTPEMVDKMPCTLIDAFGIYIKEEMKMMKDGGGISPEKMLEMQYGKRI